MEKQTRRYDLDWLRIIAIFAVYLHHVGMPFNGDNFHIMNTESSKLLDDIMVILEQFRLPLLFLISGAGTVFAFSKRSWIAFFKERSTRLLIPLVFGVLFIVPPQTYYQDINKYHSYFDIYTKFNFPTNHLWFIENLYILSIAVIPLILILKSNISDHFKKWFLQLSSKKNGILIWGVPLVILSVLLKKIAPDDSKDITNIGTTFFYGFFFISGILFNAVQGVWNHLKIYRRFNFSCFVLSFILFYGFYLTPENFISQYLSIGQRWIVWYFVCALVSWTFITSALGYGQIWLTKKSRLLQKCNEAIYPFYILHQTVLIVVGFYILKLDLSIAVKISLLLLISFPIIIFIYRFLIYPFAIPRLLFGMKKKKNT